MKQLIIVTIILLVLGSCNNTDGTKNDPMESLPAQGTERADTIDNTGKGTASPDSAARADSTNHGASHDSTRGDTSGVKH